MASITQFLWLIPVLPLIAAGITALCQRSQKKLSSTLAVLSMGISGVIAIAALVSCISSGNSRTTFNFDWLHFGESSLQLGIVLDPLSACMIVMVTFVGLLIFIYSIGYMAHDPNFTRFFCFLSLFAAAMLGLVISNSLLLLFISWELVGLASYLLIGFWFEKPSAAAAAKKAFIVTRIGDIGFFIGLLWLYSQSGTLLFYDGGNGVLESGGLNKLIAQTTLGGMAVSTAISLLIFCGAAGKSGQVPLHVWLPDAMEGPTPVSALIHAATMVAAGVFLVARIYPLLDFDALNIAGQSTALSVVTWVGAITAVFAALIAIAQNDIKRILAYSTVSQLGFMMTGVGTGGPAVGMFHLITHAFFKALLFLGAGSVIHACHEEQDITRMGGLRKFAPVTFATYAIGMMALAGVPLLFSGFWSKDEILHGASAWPVSRVPFVLLSIGTLLTAFYMTRQMCYVFFGKYRGAGNPNHSTETHAAAEPHESPPVMTWPLIILAAGAIIVGFVGTPLWPWFHSFILGEPLKESHGLSSHVLVTMAFSTLLVATGITVGWLLYGRRPITSPEQPDVLDTWNPDFFTLLRRKFLVDELYDLLFVQPLGRLAGISGIVDRYVIGGIVQVIAWAALAFGWLDRLFDKFVIDLGFDRISHALTGAARSLSHFQNGQIQRYLRVMALGMAVLVLVLLWGCAR